MASGLMVFKSVQAAINAGFQIYDRTSTGYLARTKTAAGWALAIIEVKA